MRLLLIRHGQSGNNPIEGTPDYLKGRLADPPLTELGHQQAFRLAEWAARDHFCQRITHLYTSLTTRAVQTAEPLARALHLKVHGLAEAHECGGLNSGPGGGFTPVVGRDHASLQVDCPALLWPEELHGRAWNGGHEPWESTHFAARAASVTARLRRVASDADVVALITHHDFAQYLIADLLELSASSGEALTFRLNNTATAYIELNVTPAGTNHRMLHWFNRACHLTPDSVTL